MAGEDLAYDAADPAEEEEERREAGRRIAADKRVLQTIMGGQEGRAWMYRHLEQFHIFGSVPDFDNPYRTYFSLGEENVGRPLNNLLAREFPAEWGKMMAEHQQGEQARHARRAKRNKEKTDGD